MKGDEVIKEEIEIISIMILLEEARERYIQENENNKMEFIRNHTVHILQHSIYILLIKNNQKGEQSCEISTFAFSKKHD